MKTVEDWLHELPHPYKIRALLYHSTYNKLGKADCLSNALVLGFRWSSSREGSAYWKDVHKMCLNGDFSKPEPKIKQLKRPNIYKVPKPKKKKSKKVIKVVPVVEVKPIEVKVYPPKVVEIVMYRPFSDRKKQIDILNKKVI